MNLCIDYNIPERFHMIYPGISSRKNSPKVACRGRIEMDPAAVDFRLSASARGPGFGPRSRTWGSNPDPSQQRCRSNVLDHSAKPALPDLSFAQAQVRPRHNFELFPY